MFDKPNTTGFVHVSHYLLTTYDVEQFRKSIQWPVTCKKTEAKYRNDVKDYLTIIAMENPDIGFPPILTSHLFHAGGNKFTIIMWKLSEVVLRTYIRRETNIDVTAAPKAGLTSSIAKHFFEVSNLAISANIISHHELVSYIEGEVKTVLEKEHNKLSKIKAEIFEREHSISCLISNTPVHASIKEQLTNSNKAEVIQMWKASIDDDLNYVKKRNTILKDMEHISSDIHNVIINNSNNKKVLDAKHLTRIDSFAISKLSFPPNIQCLPYHLYNGDKLVLRNFILLLNAVHNRLYQHLKLYSLKDFSQCLAQIEASCQDITLVSNFFETCLTDIAKVLAETQTVSCQKNVTQIHNGNMLQMMNDILLMPSPIIKIDTNCNDEKSDLQKRLQLTPVEGAHKSLFSRYERQDHNHTVHRSKLRENLLVSRINFDDTVSTASYEKLQSSRACFMTPKTNLSTKKRVGKYSQLFATRATKLNRTANSSIMSIPYASKANSTAIISAIGEVHDISGINLDLTVKSMCNISAELETPEILVQMEENEPANSSMRDNAISTLSSKMSMLGIAEAMQEKINHENTVKTDSAMSKRLSIGDLAKRYKKHL